MQWLLQLAPAGSKSWVPPFLHVIHHQTERVRAHELSRQPQRVESPRQRVPLRQPPPRRQRPLAALRQLPLPYLEAHAGTGCSCAPESTARASSGAARRPQKLAWGRHKDGRCRAPRGKIERGREPLRLAAPTVCRVPAPRAAELLLAPGLFQFRAPFLPWVLLCFSLMLGSSARLKRPGCPIGGPPSSTSMEHREAQAPSVHPRAPPQQLGGPSWPQPLASCRPRDEASHLATQATRRRST